MYFRRKKNIIKIISCICLIAMIVPLFMASALGADLFEEQFRETAQHDFLQVETTKLVENEYILMTLTALEDIETFITVKEQFEIIGIDCERNEIPLPEIQVLDERLLWPSVIRFYPDFLIDYLNQKLEQDDNDTTECDLDKKQSDVATECNLDAIEEDFDVTESDLDAAEDDFDAKGESLDTKEDDLDTKKDDVDTTECNLTVTEDDFNSREDEPGTIEDDCIEMEECSVKAVRFIHSDTGTNLIFLNLAADESIELLVRVLTDIDDFDIIANKHAEAGHFTSQTLFTFSGTNRNFTGIQPTMNIAPLSNQVATRIDVPINIEEIRITSPINSPINTSTSNCIGYIRVGGAVRRDLNLDIITTATETVGQPITLTAVAPNIGNMANASFQWYLGDARIPGATSLSGSTFTPQTRGNHVFQVLMSYNNNLYASNRVEVRVGGGPASREFEPIHNPVDETGITINLFNYGHGVNNFTNDSGLGFHHVTAWNPDLGHWGDREYWRIQTVNAGVHYHPWHGDQTLTPRWSAGANGYVIDGHYVRRPRGAVVFPGRENPGGVEIYFPFSRINNNVGMFHNRSYVVHRRQNELVFRNLGADGFPITRTYLRPADQHYGRWTRQTFPGRSLNYLFDPNYAGIAEAGTTAYNNRFPHNNPYRANHWVTGRSWFTDNGSIVPHWVPSGVRQNYARRTYRPQVGNSGLFQRDADGFLYYDSIQNHAYFDRTTERFELFDYIMYPYMPYIPNYLTGQPICRRPNYVQSHLGNFLPFNRPVLNNQGLLEPGVNQVIRQNVAGRRVITTAPSLWENWERSRGAIADLWLGMHVEVDFYMPRNGQVQDRNGEPIDMIFEFAGDDDVWVFINGVLVLDIGGASNADYGLINFRTGEVITYRNEEATNSISTTLREQFQIACPNTFVPGIGWHAPDFGYALYDDLLSAYHWRAAPQSGTGAGANAPARRPFNTAEFGNAANGENIDTFAPGTTHTLSFFFMERHAGLSHCMIRFNLPQIPYVTIGKEVDEVAFSFINPDIANNVVMNTDMTFDFRLDAGETAANLSARANEPFRVYTLESIGQLERYFLRTGVTNAQGIFTLRECEVAIFSNIPCNLLFRVSELPLPAADIGNITVNAPYTLTRSGDGATISVSTDPLERGLYPLVIVTNQLRAPNINDLEVVKRVSYERDPQDVFRFQVSFGENEIPYVGYYYLYHCDGEGGFVPANPSRRRVSNADGFIYLRQDEKFVIRGIVEGTIFRVEEVEIFDEDTVSVIERYDIPEYVVNVSRDEAGTILWEQERIGVDWVVEGTMYFNPELDRQLPKRVQFTNRIPIVGEIVVFKYSAEQEKKDQGSGEVVRVPLRGAEFALFIREDFDADNLDAPIRTGVSNYYGYIFFNGLPLGAYVLLETRAPAGYELLGIPIFIDITEDDLYIRVDVANHPSAQLPFTGGTGHIRVLMLSMGALLIGSVMLAFHQYQKKEEQHRCDSLIKLLFRSKMSLV